MNFRIVLLGLLFTACNTSGELNNPETPTRSALEGKWKLVSVMQEPQSTHQPNIDSTAYYKILTTNTFAWFIYSKNSGELTATAGGSYELEGEKYTEYLEYIYPHDPAIMSSSIPFRCQLNQDRWIHSGYMETREYDSLIHEYVVLSKYKLEEIWERVE